MESVTLAAASFSVNFGVKPQARYLDKCPVFDEILRCIVAHINGPGEKSEIRFDSTAEASPRSKQEWVRGLEELISSQIRPMLPSNSLSFSPYERSEILLVLYRPRNCDTLCCRVMKAFIPNTNEVLNIKTTEEISTILARPEIEYDSESLVPISLNLGYQFTSAENFDRQFKSSGSLKKMVDDIPRYASAFSNKNGGAVYWGIDDSAKCVEWRLAS
jgi:hypothetical protein